MSLLVLPLSTDEVHVTISITIIHMRDISLLVLLSSTYEGHVTISITITHR